MSGDLIRRPNVPLGYDVLGRKLLVNATEAETVRSIFERYLQLGW